MVAPTPPPCPEFDWRRPAGLAHLGIVCCTRIGQMSMVGESCLIGWQGQGDGRINVAGADHELRTGDVNFVRPQTAVSLEPHRPGSRYLALLAPMSAVTSAAIDISDGAVSEPPPMRPVLRSACLDRAGLELYFAVIGCDEPLRIRCAWLELMAQILGSAPMRLATCRINPTPVRRARDYLHEHTDELVSLDEMAGAAGVSKYHLVRLFHRAIGMSPHRYHLCIRAERGRTLLDGGATPSQAGAASGFFDQSHFTRVFKNIFGVTPGTYARTAASSRAMSTGFTR